MRRLSLPLAALAVLLSGCAGAVRTVDPGDASAVRATLDGHDGVVVLADGGRFRARALRVEPDTTSWFDVQRGELLAVPTAAVAEVLRYDRGRSAGRTAGAGALVLGGVGAVLLGAAGFESGGCIVFCGGEPTADERLSGAASFGLAGALMGAASGAFYGAIGGAVANRPERYVLAPGSADAGAAR